MSPFRLHFLSRRCGRTDGDPEVPGVGPPSDGFFQESRRRSGVDPPTDQKKVLSETVVDGEDPNGRSRSKPPDFPLLFKRFDEIVPAGDIRLPPFGQAVDGTSQKDGDTLVVGIEKLPGFPREDFTGRRIVADRCFLAVTASGKNDSQHKDRPVQSGMHTLSPGGNRQGARSLSEGVTARLPDGSPGFCSVLLFWPDKGPGRPDCRTGRNALRSPGVRRTDRC